MLQHSRLRRIRRLVAMLGASGVIALVLLLLRRRRELLTRLLPAPAAPRRCVTSAPQHDAVLLAPLPPALPRTAAPSLQLSWEGEVALVRLHRPSHANAYDGAMLEALEALVAQCEARRTPAVVFASTNARFFCAGADLQRVANPTAADALHLASQRIFARLSAASVVSIAVVEGAAVAGGFEWALSCDARLAGPAARFWLPEVGMGLLPAAGGCTRLSELVGAARAKQLILFGEKLDAPTAAAWGLVRAVSDAPLSDALSLAASLSRRSGLARQMAKQAIDHAAGAGGGCGREGSLLLERVSAAALCDLPPICPIYTPRAGPIYPDAHYGTARPPSSCRRYEAKRTPRAQLLGVGTAAPEETLTQAEVAGLLGITDPKLRALFGAMLRWRQGPVGPALS